MTGVSIIALDPERFDAGAILAQETAAILPCDTAATLTARLANEGADMVLDVMSRLDAARAAAVRQDESRATHAAKVGRADGVVAWASSTTRHLVRQFRTLHESVGLWTHVSVSPNKTERVRLVDVAAAASALGSDGASATPCPWILQGPEADVAVELASKHPEAPIGALVLHGPSKSLWVRTQDAWLLLRALQLESRPVSDGLRFARTLGIPAKGMSSKHFVDLAPPSTDAAPR